MHIDVDGGLVIDLKDCTITGFETADFKTAEYIFYLIKLNNH